DVFCRVPNELPRFVRFAAFVNFQRLCCVLARNSDDVAANNRPVPAKRKPRIPAGETRISTRWCCPSRKPNISSRKRAHALPRSASRRARLPARTSPSLQSNRTSLQRACNRLPGPDLDSHRASQASDQLARRADVNHAPLPVFFVHRVLICLTEKPDSKV